MPYDDSSGQDDRERRLAALRDIAAQASQNNAPTERMPGVAVPRQSPRQGRRLPAWALVALVVVVVVGAIGGAWLTRRGQGAKAPIAALPAVGTVALAKLGLYCPTDPLWSPDGTQIALLATASDCSNGPGTFSPAIINARTGKLVANPPMGRLLSAQGVSPQYIGMFAWTPDSKALVFAVNISPYIAAAHIPHGFAIFTVASGALKYYADPTPIPQLYAASTLIWATHTGELAGAINGLPVASAYTWSVDGRLEPGAASTPGAISFWQTGTIQPVMVQNVPNGTPIPSNSPLLKPVAFYYISTMPQWSPDGHYVALPLTLGARLPGGTQPHSKQTGQYCPYLLKQACQTGPVAPPSAGFAAVMTAAEAGWIQQAGAATIWNPVSVAWRADGQEIATMLPGQDFDSSHSSATVTIFDTHTGKQVRTLTVKLTVNNASGSGFMPNFAWSPRGSGLALVDFGDDTLTIWRSA